MQIQILCVGKIKDSYIADGISEFEKRLQPYVKLFTTEVPDADSTEKEGKLLLSKIKNGFITAALNPSGCEMTSIELAQFIGRSKLSGKNICFIIGGPSGLSKELISKTDYNISFSRLTFTHTMCRLILVEQIYRSYRILSGEPYHK